MDYYYKLHLFIANFTDKNSLFQFAEEQWEPEPDDSISDEEYYEWEERNPSWKLKDEIQFYMDSDFIEYYFGKDELGYILSLIKSEEQKEQVKSSFSEGYNSFIVIGENAIYGDMKSTDKSRLISPESTKNLVYLGEFN